jgi:hypothetical protein
MDAALADGRTCDKDGCPTPFVQARSARGLKRRQTRVGGWVVVEKGRYHEGKRENSQENTPQQHDAVRATPLVVRRVDKKSNVQLQIYKRTVPLPRRRGTSELTANQRNQRFSLVAWHFRWAANSFPPRVHHRLFVFSPPTGRGFAYLVRGLPPCCGGGSALRAHAPSACADVRV